MVGVGASSMGAGEGVCHAIRDLGIVITARGFVHSVAASSVSEPFPFDLGFAGAEPGNVGVEKLLKPPRPALRRAILVESLPSIIGPILQIRGPVINSVY